MKWIVSNFLSPDTKLGDAVAKLKFGVVLPQVYRKRKIMTYHWHHQLRSQRGLPKFSEYPDLTIFASNIVSIMRLLFFLNHVSIFFSQNFACFTKLIGQIFRHSISSKGSIHSSLRSFLNSVHLNLSNLINSFWAPSKILLNFLEPYGIFRAWFIKRMIMPKSISKWIHVTT